MHLTPREQEKLLIVVAADVTRRRRERGLKLNHPEAMALLTDELLEGARYGKTVAEPMSSSISAPSGMGTPPTSVSLRALRRQATIEPE